MTFALAVLLATLGRMPQGPAPASAPAPAGGGGTGSTVVVTQADESAFPDINVYFELKGPDGTPIRDAKREEFRVVEDGKERPIKLFDAPLSVEKRATTVILVVDRSGSMKEEGKIVGLRVAVKTFLEGMPAGSRVAVIAFGSEVEMVCPFTDDFSKVQDAIDALEPIGSTRFHDAVAEAVRKLDKEPGRKAVLALTDGQDTDSRRNSLRTCINLARRANLPVHTLGLGRDDQIDADELREMAEETRGQFYLAESSEQLRKIYEELAERLGAGYRITYQTDRPVKDGTLRPISIFHAASKEAGVAAVYIPGMVARSGGWSGLFVGLAGILAALSLLPGLLRKRPPRAA